MDAGKSRDI